MSDYFAAIFRRRPNDGWFRVGRFDATTTDILCALAFASMFLYGLGRSLFSRLLFAPSLVRDLEVWRIVTWPIATQPIFWLFISVIFFWLWGQQIESLFGRNKFLIWVLTVTIVPAVVLTFLGALSSSFDFISIDFGLSTLFLGLIWVYAATYPGVKFFEVIPIWAAAAVFTLLDILRFSGARATGQIVFLLLAIATSLVAARSLGFATGWPIPHVDLANLGSGRPTRRSKRSKRSRSSSRDRGTVVDGPWQSAPAPKAPPTGPSRADQAELDGLLDKIGETGMESLSGSEKKRLNELSKRLRNN